MQAMTIERTYKVAGFFFRVKACESLLDAMHNLEPFLSDGAQDFLFTIEESVSVPVPAGKPMYITDDGPGFPEITIWELPGGVHLFSMRPLPGKPVSSIVEINSAFNEAKLHLTGTDDVFGMNNALMLVFAFSTACKGALEMHASVVMNDGKGYLFLGKSGTGKSTHSRMWLENIPGTELLNDDNPILRLMEDGTARVFGSPWSGKTPCYKAMDVPAGAVVRIDRAKVNSIEKLSAIQAYASLMASASSFRPFASLAGGWHKTLEGLTLAVPCFTLHCLPDGDAARVCYKAVHG